MAEEPPHQITLIGLGTIGISMAALHLQHTSAHLTLHDTRPNLHTYIHNTLPAYLSSTSTLSVASLLSSGRLRISTGSLADAVRAATIIQEQGPENPQFKQALWKEVEQHAPRSAHLWSSTSGIGASVQSEDMRDKSRVLVVHPFNPPHVMPLVEIVPSPLTLSAEIDFAVSYFEGLGAGAGADAGGVPHRPVVVRKEVPGFVGNRLAFALLREACALVAEGVVSAGDVDRVVMASLGPRWAVMGVFESYVAGGGEGGFAGFLEKLAGTMQEVWDGLGRLDVLEEGDGGAKTKWKEEVVRQVEEVYRKPSEEDANRREEKLRRVIAIQEDRS